MRHPLKKGRLEQKAQTKTASKQGWALDMRGNTDRSETKDHHK